MGTGSGQQEALFWSDKTLNWPSTLATTRVLHLPIDNAQAAWLNCFLMNTDISSNIHPKHQQCGAGQATHKVYLYPQGCPTTAYCCGVFPQGHDTALVHAWCHYPELGVWCPWVGQYGCERQTHFTSSESYMTHLAVFHGVFASRDPQTPNY